ncbi:uncharacterized protein PG998_006462 [Apiospora kogelbergensis]|uniref:uncharacterized protein n=1 Tax=Apiospora kogelbergensis TaxID=1337665 RepID=UPI00312DE5AC
MDSLCSMIFCICGSDNDSFRHDAGSAQFFINEKPRPHQLPSSCPSRGSADAVVADVVSILRSAEKEGVELAKKVGDTVGAEGWTEWIAEGILNGIKAILDESPEKMGNAMKVAYDRASEAADALFQFTKDHPIATAGLLTIIAVGILVILAPAVVEALGFAELGPIEGSFAAWWESTYAGYIPKGSLFSFFQRLGMLWG